MAELNFRKIHRKIAPFIFLPLFLSAFTGIAYRVGRTWFDISDDAGEFFLVIHQGEYLGEPLIPIYVLLVGLGLIGAIVTGLSMSKLFGGKAPILPKGKIDFRSIHRLFAPIFFLPLGATAITGIAYRLGKTWFHIPKEQAKFLLMIHQGTFLGKELRVFYVLFMGLGLIALIVTGINMTGIFRKRRQLEKGNIE